MFLFFIYISHALFILLSRTVSYVYIYFFINLFIYFFVFVNLFVYLFLCNPNKMDFYSSLNEVILRDRAIFYCILNIIYIRETYNSLKRLNIREEYLLIESSRKYIVNKWILFSFQRWICHTELLLLLFHSVKYRFYNFIFFCWFLYNSCTYFTIVKIVKLLHKLFVI